jgi:creatinine amidohydrolase
MRLQDLTWTDVDALSRATPVVFPIAAVEQHGRHMPLYTDSLLLGEVVRRAADSLGDRVLFAPLQWLGNSDHHLDFPGTLSAPPRVYLDMLVGMLENFLSHGFRRLVLLNGHGGNIVPADQVVFEVRQRHRSRDDLLLLAATYWSLGAQPHQAGIGVSQSRMGHACEWETSMVLHLDPQLVRAHATVDPVPFGSPFSPATRGWITRERSTTGHIGDPRHATAEKGEALFQLFSRDVVALLERVIIWDGRSWDG